MAPDEHETRVAVARVRRPWGVHGALAVTPYSDDPARLRPGARVFAGGTAYSIKEVRRAGGALVLSFSEVTTAQAAEAFRGQELEVLASDLPGQPPGVYYHYQVIGAEVIAPAGERLGRVTEILETPANDIYVVVPDGGGPELLLPALGEIIDRVDVQVGKIHLKQSEWLTGQGVGGGLDTLGRTAETTPGGA